VYNPFDILLFIDSGQVVKNYWISTGTPTFLIKLIQQNNYFIPQLDNLRVSESLIDSYNLDNIQLEPILFQTGYLTIKEQLNAGAIILYQLCFPNLETRYSFNDFVLDYLTNQPGPKATYQSEIYAALQGCNLEMLQKTLYTLFAAIPYNNYVSNTISSYEGYYASVIYAYLASLGLDITAEDVTNKGRIDLTVKLDENIYIIEFKVDGAGNALEQIKNKNYAHKYKGQNKNIYLVGIDFDSQQRNLTGFDWEMA
nr:PD-(D/E)XK nuclease domain-containing protein [Desulfobacterales bacterium]